MNKTATPTSATFATAIVSAAAAVLLAFPTAETRAQRASQVAVEMRQVPVKDYDLYVDLPTRFAFVKAPGGWKFIGQLDEAQMAKLPPGTLTALLQDVADDAPRYAAGRVAARKF